MSLVDQIMLALAAVQVIAVAAMVLVGLGFLGTFKRARQTADPALNTAKSLANTGKSLANRLKTDGMASVNRVKTVIAAVKRRAQTTVRIAKEIKPHAEEATARVRESREAAVKTARSVTGLAGSLSRLRHAAESAARAARDGS